MHPRQRQRIIARHKSSLFQYGTDPRALYWQDAHVQTLRFEVLLQCGIQSGDSILDVGCGLADLKHYMDAQGLDVNYTGIDLSPDLLEAARQREPSLQLFAGDIFDFNPAEQAYDWVLLSGALNEPLDDNGEYLHRCLPRLYASAGKGLAFNLLNADYPWPEKDWYHLQAWPPAEILKQLKTLSTHLSYRDDYLPTDVSYFLWRTPLDQKETIINNISGNDPDR